MDMTTNKKYYKYLLLLLLILPITVHAEAVGENMCSREEIQNVMKFVGYIIMFIKLFVPLIIIGQGVFIFYNGVKAGKEDELKKCVQTLGKRILTGVIIMLLPTIIDVALSTVNDWTNYQGEYETCTECLFHPNNC